MRARTKALGVSLIGLWLAIAPTALAGPPTHLRTEARDVGGLNHACGVAVDSKGDLYAASAGESKVKVFDPAHTELTSIENTNEPCALAVDSKGNLYVLEKATGNVVRYTPNAYPFAGTPTYGAPTTIDASGNAKGIAVDPQDDRLYVAEGNRISFYDSKGNLGIDELQRVLVSPDTTGGTFKISFGGQETAPIAWDASHAALQVALEGLSTIGVGNVSVAQGLESGNPKDHSVVFKGALGHADLELLSADISGLTGPSPGVTLEERSKGISGHLGEGDLTEATGVAVYSYRSVIAKNFEGKLLSESGTRYLFVADPAGAGPDTVKILTGSFDWSSSTGMTTFGALKHHRTISAVDHDRNPETPAQTLGFGAAGAYLAVDRGNGNADLQCASIAEQGCTAGHLLVYDESHEAVDEFDASGEFLDQLSGSPIADAEPTAMAIERSGAPGDGMIYVTTGAGSGAEALAFGPLVAPGRATLPAPLSHVLANAEAVATDAKGNVYAAADAAIEVYDPSGKALTSIADPNAPLDDLAVDSTGRVFVLEKGPQVTYYTPSVFPPVSGTTYARHEPPVATKADFGNKTLLAIAVNPGPGAGKDHLFVTSLAGPTHEYDSAVSGSTLLDANFAAGLCSGAARRSVAVHGATGNVYFGVFSRRVCILDEDGEEEIARISGGGSPKGQLASDPKLAVDQANGHVVAFGSLVDAALEYDASGGFVAEFGKFTSLGSSPRIAMDNSCALHDPPLTEATTPSCAEFYPSAGNVYVAFDDPAPDSFDISAFGPLSYGEAPAATSGGASGLGAGDATLSGTVDPGGFELSECSFEYLTDAQYLTNGKTFAGATAKACAESPATIGNGSDPVSVHANVSGLDPEEHYRFRLVATNKYGEDAGDAVLFGPPLIETKTALPIFYDEATLRARIDPSGLTTKYRFEYGTSEAYGQSTPTQQIAAGAPSTDVQAALTGLAEGTTYHFRVVAENEAKAVMGPDQTFVTQQRRAPESCPNAEHRTGLSAGLPDCRAYELVTPAQTNGLAPHFAGPDSSGARFNTLPVVPHGAGAGEVLSYFTEGTLPGFEGNGRLDGYRATRSAGDHPPAGWGTEFFGVSFVRSGSSTPGSRGISPDQGYSFWNNSPVTVFPETLPQGNYLRTPDASAAPACNPVLGQSSFEFVGCGSEGTDPEAQSHYVSSGGAHVVFGSKAQLEPGAPPEGNVALYDRQAGTASAHVLTLPPTGGSEEEQAEFLNALRSEEQASFRGVSENGASVVFRAGAALYVRLDNASTETISPSTAKAGDPLACAAGPLIGIKDPRNFQWLRNATPIPGASGDDAHNSTDYATTPADEGAALQCRTVVKEDGTGSVAISAPVEIVPLGAGQPPKPPAQMAAPTPPDPVAGTVETCDAGTWQGAESLAYQWYLDGDAIPGATTQTYEVQAADLPGTLQCVVSGSNAAATVARASALRPTSPAPAEAAPVATAQAAVKATYAGVSDDGRYVFFALGNGESPARLFRFDTQSESATEIAASGIFVNASADGSAAFFSSEDALTGAEENEAGETAEAGEHNLYVWDGIDIRFIAILDPEDFSGFDGIAAMNLGAWTTVINPGATIGRAKAPTRSTPDGDVFVFQSHAQLTDYDNEGKGMIYRYDPAAQAGERLTCLSCDPSGAPASKDALLQDISSQSGVNVDVIIPNLTDGGSEVFFQSADPLLPEDANEVLDVYEWQAKGSVCKRPGGCLALISSGQGESPSVLYAMSADGHDVFFRTLEKLVGADVAGSPSIYDARVGGGIPEPASEAPCQGDACQGQGATPPALPVPASAAGSGEDSTSESRPRTRCPKGKRKVRRAGKTRCVKQAKKSHRRHKASAKGRAGR